jgi:hypothetical protein
MMSHDAQRLKKCPNPPEFKPVTQCLLLPAGSRLVLKLLSKKGGTMGKSYFAMLKYELDCWSHAAKSQIRYP